jgi:hypothetical protein
MNQADEKAEESAVHRRALLQQGKGAVEWRLVDLFP